MGKNKKQMDDAFLPRREKVKKIRIPESTEGCLIIKPNFEGLGYRLDCYDESRLSGKVNQERFNETVFNCSKICQQVWSHKRLREENDPMKEAKEQVLMTSLILAGGIICFLLSAYGSYTQDTKDRLGLAGIVLVFLQAVIALWIVFKQVVRTEIPSINLESECKKQLKIYLMEENEYYNHCGLNWVIGDNFFWLELYVMLRN